MNLTIYKVDKCNQGGDKEFTQATFEQSILISSRWDKNNYSTKPLNFT